MGDDLERLELERIIQESWDKVADALSDGILNSERALQSFLYAKILSHEAFVGRIAVEPHWQSKFGECLPDLVIWSSPSRIDAIIELKFVPGGYPVWEGDVRKLQNLSTQLCVGYPIFDVASQTDANCAIHDQTIFCVRSCWA